MTIRFACPACQKSLRVGDQYGGRRASCPNCSAAIDVPAPSAEPAPPPPPPAASAAAGRASAVAVENAFEFESAPSAPAELPGDNRDHGRPSAASGWASVRGGLELVRLGTMCNIAAVALGTMLLLGLLFFGAALLFQLFDRRATSQFRGNSADTGQLFLVVLIGAGVLIGLVSLAGAILRIVGFARCMQVPEQSGARGLAVGSLVCELVPVGGYAIILLDLFVGLGIGNLGQLANGSAALAGLVFVLLFLRQLGVYLRHQRLPGQVIQFVIWLAVGVFVMMALFCIGMGTLVYLGLSAIGFRSRGTSTDFAEMGLASMLVLGICAVVYLATYVAIVVKYMNLLSLASEAIARRQRE